jgi:site-specific recombinase XerD
LHSSIDQYLEVLHTKRRAPATLKVVRQDLTHFVAWWEHTLRRMFDPALLRHEDLRDWRLARQRDDGAAPATINRGLASLRGYCQWATLSHLLTENPAIDIEDVPTDPLAPRSLPTEAVDALLRVARAEQHPLLRTRNEALLGLLIYAGLRVQEACNLQLRDLDLEGGTVTVRSGKAEKHVVFHSILMQSVCCIAILRAFAALRDCLPLAATRSESYSWSGLMSREKVSRLFLESLSESPNEPCNGWGNVRRNNCVQRRSGSRTSHAASLYRTWPGG